MSLAQIKREMDKNITILSDLDKYEGEMFSHPQYINDFVEGLIKVIVNYQYAYRLIPVNIKGSKDLRDALTSLLDAAKKSKNDGDLNTELLTQTINFRNFLNEEEIEKAFKFES